MGAEEEGIPRRHPLSALVRFVLHWLIKIPVLLVLGLRALFRRRVLRYATLTLLIVGFVAWQNAGSLLSLANTTALNASPATPKQQLTPDGDIALTTGERLPPSPVVERYIQALADYDASGMWALMSDGLKEYMQENNGGLALERLQGGLETLRQRGGRFIGGTYVGGKQLADGQSVYFYVLKVETPMGELEAPYTYTVDADGMLVGIDQE